jgi:hypothetical protein
MGLSGMLLYAQPSLLRALKRDSQISKFVEEGDLLVVEWNLFNLRQQAAKETQGSKLVGASPKGSKRRRSGTRRPLADDAMVPPQVWCGTMVQKS